MRQRRDNETPRPVGQGVRMSVKKIPWPVGYTARVLRSADQYSHAGFSVVVVLPSTRQPKRYPIVSRSRHHSRALAWPQNVRTTWVPDQVTTISPTQSYNTVYVFILSP
jgi:CTP:molybdopterin cytidylyltransferase MocA